MKLTAILLCVAELLLAQSPPRFMATTGDVSLTAAGTTFTIQQPSANAATVSLESAVVYCSVACNITQTQNGTAATATAGTVRALPPMNAPSTATVWTASNVGAGTATAGIIHLAAGSTVVIDLSKIALQRGGTGVNYSIIVSTITGTANITLYWSEQQ